MARPKSGSHEIPTDVQILNAAESAFGELGRNGQHSLISPEKRHPDDPSLLYHFKSKDEIVATSREQHFGLIAH